jgi:sulfite reductase beta subunit-like hemoprotein
MDNSGVNQNRSVDNEAIQSIHQQDSELQKSTMLLSQPDIRAVTILELPDELLRKILDHFQDPVTEYVAVQWSEL